MKLKVRTQKAPANWCWGLWDGVGNEVGSSKAGRSATGFSCCYRKTLPGEEDLPAWCFQESQAEREPLKEQAERSKSLFFFPPLLTATRAPYYQDPAYNQRAKPKRSLQSPSSGIMELERARLEMRDNRLIVGAVGNISYRQHLA